jgi:hypothetical protein
MAKWPPFQQAFPALTGDWQGNLRQAIVSNDSAAVDAISTQLGVLSAITGEVPEHTFSRLVWLLRPQEIRSRAEARTVMHFFTTSQRILTDDQKRRIAWRLELLGEPGMAEMVFDPLAGLR